MRNYDGFTKSIEVNINCITDSTSVNVSIAFDVRVLNSSLPFLMKYKWIVKAKSPLKERTIEKISPAPVPS